MDSTYNWQAEQWTVPINLGVLQVLVIGKQALSLQLGGKYDTEPLKAGRNGE